MQKSHIKTFLLQFHCLKKTFMANYQSYQEKLFFSGSYGI
jgi:hypothetical protein